MTDDDIWRLNRGGHDPHKVYAAFHAAANHKGQPTVILAKTVKGYGMGKSGEAQESDAPDQEARRRSGARVPRPLQHSDPGRQARRSCRSSSRPRTRRKCRYLHERRKALGGYLPQRRRKADEKLPVPELWHSRAVLEPTAEGREISTTQAFVRILTSCCATRTSGQRVVPIVADEARTFGMEGLFRQIGISASRARSTSRSTRTR